MIFRRSLAALVAASAVAGLVTAASAQQTQITGAGATFPAPVYTAWGEAAKSAIGIELNYQPIGSGGGQNQILNRTVDFGASDAPMAPQKLEQGKLLQFPSVMGAVVVIVNLPGIEANQMKLTGELLGDIYLGKITHWNDPRLVEANHGLKLPHTAIAPVYRADGSGTTFVFTSYLSTVSPEWKGKVGANTSVKWITGNGAKGNAGVAATVKQVRGGIGYVENAYATQNKLTTTQLRNKAGNFVEPTLENFQAAAENGDWANAKNFAISLIEMPGDKSWPIVSATFIELPKDPKDPVRSGAVMKFFDWAYTSGGDIANKLQYIPLPKPVQDSVRAAWRSEVKAPDGQPIFH
jgi:phosphate transport system substrate-binding protein